MKIETFFMIHTVAIQGAKGSFHHIVSREFFNTPVDVIECMTFDRVVDALINNECEAAIMALENSIAGSIIPNYALIDDYALRIVGEHYLDIQHNLMALPGQRIEDIEEVYSHPMALLQCKAFFKDYPHIKLVEDKDTAEVAERIQKKKLAKTGAIASVMAAEIFELNVMSDCKLNLTKIQSLPIIKTPWKYAFFVDVTFDAYEDFAKAKSIIEIMGQSFKVLGEYKNAKL
jgi:prephenate dehydratase